MIPLLLDQGLPRRAAEDLSCDDGWDVLHVGAIGLGASPDDEVLEAARSSGRVMVTLDSDFGTLLAAGGSTSPSVLYLRIPFLNRENTVLLLRRVIPLLVEDLRRGVIAVVEEAGIRVRELPVK